MRIRLLAIIIPALSLGGCYGLYGNDEMDRYFQRSDTITMSAGNDVDVFAFGHAELSKPERRAIAGVPRPLTGHMLNLTPEVPYAAR